MRLDRLDPQYIRGHEPQLNCQYCPVLIPLTHFSFTEIISGLFSSLQTSGLSSLLAGALPSNHVEKVRAIRLELPQLPTIKCTHFSTSRPDFCSFLFVIEEMSFFLH